MDGVNLADAKARLSELVDLAERGEEIEILRRGRPVARLVAIESERAAISLDGLRAVTAGQPEQSETAEVSVRRMRDGYRY